MSGLLRRVGVMLRNYSNTPPILSRDIINEAKNRTTKMLDHIILQTPVVDDTLKSHPLSDRPEDVHQVYSIEQRIKALVLEMGENRALSNADVTMSRLERAWHLRQESHHDLANQYDTLVNKLRTLARDIGFDPVIASAEDVPGIVMNLDQIWRQIQNNLREVTGALDLKNTHIKELAAFLRVKTPVTESTVFDGIMVRWTDQLSKFNDLEKALKEKQEESRPASQALQNTAKLMGVVQPQRKDTLKASIVGDWNRSQKMTVDLQQELFQQKEQVQRAGEQLQNFAKFCGVAPTPVVGTNILDVITGKWEESKSLISQLRSSLLLEKDKNSQAHETLQGLADFIGVETSGCESTIVRGMMDRWTENRREVIELQRALMEEKEKTKQAQEALQTHLSRPGPVLSSTVLADGSRPGDDTTRIQLSPKGDVQRKRDPVFYCKAEKELQLIKEHLSLSISYRSHSFTSSASREIIHLGPRCLSLKTFSAGDAFKPPNRSSLLRGVSAIASAIGCSSPPSDTSIRITKMSDLIPWEESRCRIKLGSGVSGTVFLFRHAVSKIPVAAKVVEYPGESFQDEVRIHQAISGLPWFPTFYGSFEIAGHQAVLAMEFIGEDSDDRSHTISDCIDKSSLKTGPDLTRKEWFDVLRDVAEGLEALHLKGFLSNDLKEDNVLVVHESGRWRAKIIDLGWASEIANPFAVSLDKKQIDKYKGGKWYRHVAPECVLDAKPFSTSSDVYSLGRMLASVGRAMGYDDFQSYGMQIYQANEKQRPTVQEVIDKLDEMQLEDDPGTSIW